MSDSLELIARAIARAIATVIARTDGRTYGESDSLPDRHLTSRNALRGKAR